MNKHVVTILLVVLGLGLSACGKKGDPGLPMPIVPDAPSRFQVVARSEGIFILWRAPDKNVNDTELLDLGGFKIMRANEPIEKFCPKCPKNTAQLTDIAYKGDRGKPPGKQWYYYKDTAIDFGMVYFYQMHAYNEREKDGKSTKPVVVYWDRSPAAPAELMVHPKNKLLQLSWQRVATLENGSPLEGFAGYNIYRTTQQGVYEEGPVNQEPVQETQFEDAPETLDVTYYYTVRAARMVKETPVESAASGEVQAVYKDVTPPDVPQDLVAIQNRNGVLLKWIGISQKAVAGYNVYRKEAGGFVRLNDSVIMDTSWFDTTVKDGSSYIYAVTSVDASARGKESPMSDTASVTFKLP